VKNDLAFFKSMVPYVYVLAEAFLFFNTIFMTHIRNKRNKALWESMELAQEISDGFEYAEIQEYTREVWQKVYEHISEKTE